MQMTGLTDFARAGLVALALVPVAARAQSNALAALDGKRITFTVVSSVNGVRPTLGPFTGAEVRLEGEVRISGNSVSGSRTRTMTYRGQLVGSSTRDLSGSIGQAHNTGARGGNYVWAFDGHSLTLLTTRVAGGGKLTITFSGGGCSVRTALMHEAGAGATRMRTNGGGFATTTSSRQVSSTCSIGG